uniref:Legume lectin domain-containing protein n=1 Tax=Oryza glumipatula TaxID=40148 RepID=A0A0D9YT37_9ORYZ
MAPLELPKPRTPLLSAAVNLSAVIEDEAYVGFSSSTGVVASRAPLRACLELQDGRASTIAKRIKPAGVACHDRQGSVQRSGDVRVSLHLVPPLASSYAELHTNDNVAMGPSVPVADGIFLQLLRQCGSSLP